MMNLELTLQLYLKEMAKSEDKDSFYKYIPSFSEALRQAGLNTRLFTKYYLEYRKIDYWKKNNNYKPFEVEE